MSVWACLSEGHGAGEEQYERANTRPPLISLTWWTSSPLPILSLPLIFTSLYLPLPSSLSLHVSLPLCVSACCLLCLMSFSDAPFIFHFSVFYSQPRRTCWCISCGLSSAAHVSRWRTSVMWCINRQLGHPAFCGYRIGLSASCFFSDDKPKCPPACVVIHLVD